jgi:hypothetical protein
MLRSILHAHEPAQAEKRVLVKAAVPGLAAQQLDKRKVRNQDDKRKYRYQGIQVDTPVHGKRARRRICPYKLQDKRLPPAHSPGDKSIWLYIIIVSPL